MKKFLKRMLILLLIVLVTIQFFHPAKNKSAEISNNDITKAYPVPQDVQAILQTSCYDCHSNNTIYPWYSKMQPVAWWLNNHIQEGKEELNFSEFATYRIGRQYRKFEEISKEVKEDEMPLASYLIIHKDAVLDASKKSAITNWVKSMRDSLEATYPKDSLVKKRK